MKYNIIDTADMHWGAVNPVRMDYEMNILYDFIDECFANNIPIHLLNINGDWWNSKSSLNSKTALYGIHHGHKIKDYAKKYGFKVVFTRGTLSHDNDQLDVFDDLVDDIFIIVRECTLMEILPGFNALYCPDENIPSEEYYLKYLNEMLVEQTIHAGYFHGNFDIIMAKLPDQETEVQSINNVVFKLDYFSKLIEGPLMSGHWHTRGEYEDLAYIGSFSRFGHNEEEDKGFYFTTYDTDNNSYYRKFIKNPLAREYRTYNIFTHTFTEIEQYSKFISVIKDELKADQDTRLRLVINLTDDKMENNNYVKLLRETFVNDKRVNVQVKNKLKEKQKNIIKEKRKLIMKKYGYIIDKNRREEENLQKFCIDKYDTDIPIDFINKYAVKVREKQSKKLKVE